MSTNLFADDWHYLVETAAAAYCPQQPVRRRQPEPARKARVFAATTSNSRYVTVAILSDPITLSAKTFRSFSG